MAGEKTHISKKGPFCGQWAHRVSEGCNASLKHHNCGFFLTCRTLEASSSCEVLDCSWVDCTTRTLCRSFTCKGPWLLASGMPQKVASFHCGALPWTICKFLKAERLIYTWMRQHALESLCGHFLQELQETNTGELSFIIQLNPSNHMNLWKWRNGKRRNSERVKARRLDPPSLT